MRFLVLMLIAGWTSVATADLYRWVDPESGSVKFSSYPPPWYGDEASEKRAPKVEHIPPRSAGSSAPARLEDPARPRGADSATEGGLRQELAKAMEVLNERRKALMATFAVLQSKEDFDRAGAGIRQQVEAYQAVSAELDRLDPKGAERRRTDSQPVLQRIGEGLRAQFSPAPPVRER